MREEVTFSRSAEAIMIPSGEKVLVPVGAQATITQSLGGTYTLITDRGLMVRVSGQEVEAIGKTPHGRRRGRSRKSSLPRSSRRWCGTRSRPATTPRSR